ncbi:MAG: hypothetical protein AAFZ18_19610 [Myxococcota bacterium]
MAGCTPGRGGVKDLLVSTPEAQALKEKRAQVYEDDVGCSETIRISR